jgi:shikimate kinase
MRKKHHPALPHASAAVPQQHQAVSSVIKRVSVSKVPLRLILTGFMGAGKSTIGRLLAQALQYQFLDTDHYIEKLQGKRCATVFETLGEPAFRLLEDAVFKQAVQRVKTVISTGGGTLAKPENMSLALSRGRVIYLNAPVEYLFERVIHSPRERPIVKEPDAEALFHQKYHERQALYTQAHVQVSTYKVQPKEVVAAILEALNLKPE